MQVTETVARTWTQISFSTFFIIRLTIFKQE